MIGEYKKLQDLKSATMHKKNPTNADQKLSNATT